MTSIAPKLAQVLAALLMMAFIGPSPANAQDNKSLPTVESLKDSLTPPQRRVRRDINPKTMAERQFILKRSIVVESTAKKGYSPAITDEDRKTIAEISKDKRAIDLEVYFDYDSATITPKAKPSLDLLGKVLSDSTFKGTVFFINGHTDAAGGSDYNLELSQRRAEAVRGFLVDT